MKKLLIGLLLIVSTCVEAQQFIVADLESRAPLRDVLVHTDDNQDTRTIWDGTFLLKDGFNRISFSHPLYEKRYVLKSELKGDTIFLLPNELKKVRQKEAEYQQRWDSLEGK